ncbi:hypothetical protein [Amycolatopsis sp. lyj-23]|uniref:hypothetical protein n=1 Tax=Amycolatopsis sp. lyj-23 TaxID=2789283 RepID=UPI00397A4B28
MHGNLLANKVWDIDADIFAGWGQWAGAAGSIAAVVVALGIAIRDGRMRDKERRDAEKAQARTVTAEVRQLPRERWNAFVSPFAVTITNHGNLPITQVALITVICIIDGRAHLKWQIKNAHDEHADQTSYFVDTVIGPGENSSAAVLSFADADRDSKIEPRSSIIEIEFVDAQGLRWRKTNNGEPIRVINLIDKFQTQLDSMKSNFLSRPREPKGF